MKRAVAKETLSEVILQCPRCLAIRVWDRERIKAPGDCSKCHTVRPWNVLNTMPARGHVIVYSSQGSQELHGPHWQENPNAWRRP